MSKAADRIAAVMKLSDPHAEVIVETRPTEATANGAPVWTAEVRLRLFSDCPPRRTDIFAVGATAAEAEANLVPVAEEHVAELIHGLRAQEKAAWERANAAAETVRWHEAGLRKLGLKVPT